MFHANVTVALYRYSQVPSYLRWRKHSIRFFLSCVLCGSSLVHYLLH